MSSAPAQEPPVFIARFENDAEGTWLVYPTIPGWHYRMEGSPSLNEADFSCVPGSFRYGDGQDLRWWIAPPPPPATPPDPPPPPRIYTSLHVTLYVATDDNVEMVEAIRTHNDHPWSARIARVLPLRRNAQTGEPLPAYTFFTLGNSPTESWILTGSVRPRLLQDFESDPGGPQFAAGSPEEAEYQFLLAHWEEALGHLTPTEEDAAQAPPQPPEGTPPPPPDASIRRFYRVHQTAIDTNGNGLYDWWELQHGYTAFADSGEAGYADPYADDDRDGLSNRDEYLAGTDPRNPDSDGDLALDGQEKEHDTNPLDANSTPLLLVSVGRYHYSNMFLGTGGEYSWAAWGRRQSGPDANGSMMSELFFSNPEQATEFLINPEQGTVFNTGYPDFHHWHTVLEEMSPFTASPPWWAREYSPYGGSILPAFADDPRSSVPQLIGAGFIDLSQEEVNALDQRRIWLRGPLAGAGGYSPSFILRKERVRGHRSQPAGVVVVDDSDTRVSVVTFTVPEGQRVSNFHDLLPTFETETGTAPSPTHFHVVRWSLVAPEAAPTVLRVNSDFDEQGIGWDGAARPDCDDLDLRADRDSIDPGIQAGDLVIDDLHPGWFGMHPQHYDPSMFADGTVRIRRKNTLDSETNRPESGEVRLWVTRVQGETIEQWPVPIVDTNEASPPNLTDSIYGANAPVPRGEDVNYWMEGIKPGKITLEFSYTGPKGNIILEQPFLVATHQTKQQWIREIRDQILLQTGVRGIGNHVDLNYYLPASGWKPSIDPNGGNDSFVWHSPRVAEIYEWYGQLYQQYPDKLDWMGAASLMGDVVYAGLCDVTSGFPGAFLNVPPMLMGGQILIFRDLGWQHRAWLASGRWALKWVAENDSGSINQIPNQLGLELNNWLRFDDAIAANNWVQIKDATRDLVRREQAEVIVPMWTQMENAEPVFLNIMSAGAKNPVDSQAPTFQQVVPYAQAQNYLHRSRFAFGWEGTPDLPPGLSSKGVFPIWWGDVPGHTDFTYSPAIRLQVVRIPIRTRAQEYLTVGYIR